MFGRDALVYVYNDSMMTTIDIDQTETKQMTITVPATVSVLLDKWVTGQDREQFVTAALMERLLLLEQSEAFEETAGLWKDEDYPHLIDDEAIDQWIADLRSGRSVSHA